MAQDDRGVLPDQVVRVLTVLAYPLEVCLSEGKHTQMLVLDHIDCAIAFRYVAEADPLPLCKEFASGYVQHGELTLAEIEAIPELINLRIFSNTVRNWGCSVVHSCQPQVMRHRCLSQACIPLNHAPAHVCTLQVYFVGRWV